MASRKYVANPANLPEGTLVEAFFKAVDEFDKADAMLDRDETGWRPISHREVVESVRYASEALAASGIGREARVAVLSENRPEWAFADYAALCIGALNVPIYPTLPANQIAYILTDAEVSIVFVSTAEQLAKLIDTDALEGVRRIIVFDDVQSADPRVTTWEAFMDEGRASAATETDFRQRALEVRPSDVATLIYTSGTTGQPKGVMLTHNNLFSNVIAAVGVNPAGPADIALSFLPLSHVLQRVVDYGMFAFGCTIAYVRSFDDVARALVEVKPTIAVAVPRVYEKLYARILAETGIRRKLVLWARQVALDWAEATLHGESPGLWTQLQHALADRLVYSRIRERLGGRLRFFVSGGAPLAPQIALFFYGAGVIILEGYGLTETSPVTNVNTIDDLRIGTVGKPVSGTEIMIAEDGEILVRGPQVMKGYYRNPEATAEVIDEEGWFHTGDIGDLDGDGFLRITDRKKQLIVTAGGKNVAPQPIENAAKTSPLVSEAVLIGDRRPYTILLVVPNFAALEQRAKQWGVTVSGPEALVADAKVREQIEAAVGERLKGFARYEQPKKVLPLPHELTIERGELTPSLKVKRRVVEEHFREAIESLYAEPTPAAVH